MLKKNLKLRFIFKTMNILALNAISPIDGRYRKSTQNHDVKAVEYFLKEAFTALGFEKYLEYIHFGLTSQDINNTAIPLSFQQAVHEVYFPHIESLIAQLQVLNLAVLPEISMHIK
jgi:adenylosuccinate lyase